jgi:aspartyl-tRNA(Asn)/glutamyl-tRNA(Gln) amidotransferase subunit A
VRRRDALAVLLAAPAWTRVAAAAQAPAPGDELVWLTVEEAAERISSGALQRERLIEAYLRRIERLNPLLNAYVAVTADRAREQARRAAVPGARLARRPPLDGIPVAHKDLFETAGVRTTAGSRLYDRHVPEHDATLVARLAAAGAVMLGKTNTHELGGGVTTINPFFGTTRNPWVRSRIAGGSSGGSAVAVAAGLAAAATGSDTGGSVRIPAAFCGCVGFKPSFGRVSTAGLLGASPSFDHSGILTRTVADAVLIYREIASYDPADASTVHTPAPAIGIGPAPPGRSAGRPHTALGTPDLSGLRLGVARNFFFDALQEDVARVIADAVDVFRAANGVVRDITFPIDGGTMARVFDPIIVAEIHERFARDWKERPEAFSPAFAGFFQAPLPSGLELAAAHRALREYQAAVRQLFDTVDIVLTPTVAMTAPPIEGPIDGALILRNTWPFNAARTPVMSVPCGFDRHGLPIGLQIVAAPYDDETLFRAAHGFQALTRFHLRHPSL